MRTIEKAGARRGSAALVLSLFDMPGTRFVFVWNSLELWNFATKRATAGFRMRMIRSRLGANPMMPSSNAVCRSRDSTRK